MANKGINTLPENEAILKIIKEILSQTPSLFTEVRHGEQLCSSFFLFPCFQKALIDPTVKPLEPRFSNCNIMSYLKGMYARINEVDLVICSEVTRFVYLFKVFPVHRFRKGRFM